MTLKSGFIGGAFVGFVALAAACAGDPHGTAASEGAGGSNDTGATYAKELCKTVGEEGCPCVATDAPVACGNVDRRDGNYVTCSPGTRSCDPTTNKWGTCKGDTEVRPQTINVASLAASSAACAADPCDPACTRYTDNATGVSVPTGLTNASGGIQLAATGTFNVSSCTGLTITPSATTLTVTQLSPVSPSAITFTTALVPAGCYPGVPTPIFTVNDTRADSVTISGSQNVGTMTVVTPIAAPVTVNAFFGAFTATSTVQVNVDVLDTSAAPSGFASSFTSTSGGTDSLSLLYPYSGTVFPLGLPPPIPQWLGASAANAVKVQLRYVNGSTSFKWAAIAPDTANLYTVGTIGIGAGQRYTNIPTTAWFDFERTAKGQNAEIVVQRIVASSLKSEISTQVKFANGQLRGNVYYQAYGTQLAKNFYGGAIDSTGGLVFPGGAMGAATMAISPGATAPTVIAGSTNGNAPDGAGTYCRVCHSASADGSVLITQKFGNGNYTSQKYTNLSGTPAYTDMTATSDGRYAWPAIYPNGSYLFGNTGPTVNYNSSLAPGGLDASNPNITSSFYSLANGMLGAAKSVKYHTTGNSPIDITLATSAWGLQGAVPSFSATGAKVAMNFYGGKVCNTGTAAQCSTAELAAGDKRSLAVMDWADSTSTLTNFKVVVNEPNTPCNTTFHPTQPCFDVWPTFMPFDKGLVYEREIMNNGNVGGGLGDFGGTRSGCDSNGVCNNDGTKGELWWVNLTGTATPTRLNKANGRNASNVSYLPVGIDAPSMCRISGSACTLATQCCSSSCSNSRCITSAPRPSGAACASNGDCESNSCVSLICGCVRDADCATTCNTSTNRCASNLPYTPQAQGYVPGHNAIVEPVLNYEPTMNPTPTYDSVGTTPEFYWVVFTSRREFGNVATVDPWWSDPRRQDLSQKVNPKKLWVAAVSADPTAGTDPSFPAFLLPGQEWVSGNSKAYWVQNACKAGSATKSAATLCDTNQDCCAGSVCQLDVPVSNPAQRYCVTSGACVAKGASCSQSSDCCGGRLCSSGSCQDPPTIPYYGATATFTRDFDSGCQPGFLTKWRYFDWQAVLPAGTSILFKARSTPTTALLPTATPLATVATALPPSTTTWTSSPSTVDTVLKAAGGSSERYLRVEMTLNPSANQVSTPTLTDWRVAFECIPNE